MPTHNNCPTITVGQLRDALKHYPDDFEIGFSGLTYYRIKQRGDRLLQLEFNEAVSRTDDGKVSAVSLD